MKAYMIKWIYGVKSDGYSLHTSKEESERYIKRYWNKMHKMPDVMQNNYSIPESYAKEVLLTEEGEEAIIPEVKNARIKDSSIRVYEYEKTKYVV